MKANRKLYLAWGIFFAVVVLFVIIIEAYHNFRCRYAVGYHYRILIDKDTIRENDEKEQECMPSPEIDADDEFYEQTKYGYLPKISSKGERVFDRYAVCAETAPHKKLRVAVLVDNGDRIGVAVKLKGQKVTFVIPHHMRQLEETVKIIHENGHEFFIQMPTQASVVEDENGIIAPFLANDNLDSTLDKLFHLISVAKYALGVANTSKTLFTKSSRDMTVVAEELTKRGLAFFDAEKSNDLMTEISQSSGLIYIRSTKTFETSDFDISKLRNGDILAIRLENLEMLIKELPSNFMLTPVSAAVKNTHAII
ncbi:MAG: divergent polysaccharide deacetylase family protein [Holosporaceae bacterium]|nr:divergent polysaccharide deacetylase family protein [Holosporaceae bacterium]